jgi:septin family protein
MTYSTHAPAKLQLDRMAQMTDSFALNFMVVGESGLGKTTFLKAICACLPNDPEVRPHDGCKTVGEPSVIFNHEFEEGGVQYKFSAVDAAGFEVKENVSITGDPVDSEANFQPIMQYITNKQDQWAQCADPDGRSEKSDERIHCLFYFIRPHRVQEIDLTFMQRFSKVVNIVPIIAKADTLTRDELTKQLRELHQRLSEKQIRIFDFEETESANLQFLPEVKSEELLPDYAAVGSALAGHEVPLPPLPRNRNMFAVITSAPGTARQYVYGTASMMDKRHSDFPRLIGLLFEAPCLQLRELRRKALDKANHRIRQKAWQEAAVDHPATPPTSVALVAVFVLIALFAEYSISVWGSWLLVLASAGVGVYAKRKQDLPFRYWLNKMALYVIAILAISFICFGAQGSVDTVTGLGVCQEGHAALQQQVALLNATLTNTVISTQQASSAAEMELSDCILARRTNNDQLKLAQTQLSQAARTAKLAEAKAQKEVEQARATATQEAEIARVYAVKEAETTAKAKSDKAKSESVIRVLEMKLAKIAKKLEDRLQDNERLQNKLAACWF